MIMGYREKLRDILSMAREVKRQSGYGYCAQLRDILRLYRSNPTCDIWDYYKLGVYHHSPLNRPIASSYLGHGSLAAISEALNPRHAVTAAWDKLVFHMVTDLHNLPTARNVAAFKSGGPLPVNIPRALETRAALVAFLQDPCSYPVFMKPVHAQQNIGGYYLNTYEPETGLISSGPEAGEKLSVDALITKTIDLKSSLYDGNAGYLFQEPIKQHQTLTELTGTRAPSGLRLIVVQEPNGLSRTIHRSIIKLTREGNYSDNFRGGASGNLIAGIDQATGRLSPAVTGFWPFAQECQRHPNTGHSIVDTVIPNWHEIVERVFSASRIFSALRILHWDVIVGPDGPIFLELNDLGGTDFVQLHGTGFIDEFMADFVRRNGHLKSCQKSIRKRALKSY